MDLPGDGIGTSQSTNDSDFTGCIRLMFYEELLDNSNDTNRLLTEDESGNVTLLSWICDLYIYCMGELIAWWVQRKGYSYRHVALKFSNGVSVSVTHSHGVCLLDGKLFSNKNYSLVLQVHVGCREERNAYEYALKMNNRGFNSFGKYWNSMKILRYCYVVNTDDESFYCSELITKILCVADDDRGEILTRGINASVTNPTELFLDLKAHNATVSWKYELLPPNEECTFYRSELLGLV